MENAQDEHQRSQLGGDQIRALRARGHHMEPVLIIGKEGINAMVLLALDQTLTARELVKVKLGPNCPLDKQGAARTLTEESGAALVQILGKTILLYRAAPETAARQPGKAHEGKNHPRRRGEPGPQTLPRGNTDKKSPARRRG